ncbi:hypothetical protein pEaSNUABM14_00077 [Erwinia phage pEa_SNUABM_14]|uniref:Uncharacterized protein n=1 Tax=Erwinia phage pEa_SNUABM_7 TaxID=2866695 RepID=A0AAE7WS61_9CAUD|nr:hypothetical protein MPK74_gp078 [Erwinia phage pEa_SNUABM_7]QYW03037.1 hypothetical protein pEaSNUABM13_00078 [Erwinia phage pEa_SNUABM_13]QYW03378.1 hypothetical protein pEaSNUABM34_00076 [Erwinia phage pEa_SNUABM_34]QYW04402.1 hypothetical protein pEaSNUABM14_00077 [Erwinia phage pEa_SNUABM_14]QYW05091.1 hypothetical protein pEaSNUABM21_00077 [Erwinia phage pEa_SNUABM_21]QYW05433.1 hypothetical protein pEaSNUABM25_00077 [Erwinia phage pEa_SNUABM_25]
MSEKTSGIAKAPKSRNGAMISQTYAGAEVGSARAPGISTAGSIVNRINNLSNEAYSLRDTLRQIGVIVEVPAKGSAGEAKAAAPSMLLDVIKTELGDVVRFTQNVVNEAVHGADCGHEDKDCGEEEDKENEGSILSTEYGRTIFYAVGRTTDRLSDIRRQVETIDRTFFGDKPNDNVSRVQNSSESVVASVSVLIDNLDDTIVAIQRLNGDLRANILGENV